ncbi:MAG: NYN domain-containing protein [Acidobacteriota bacterium]|nr:NYN domain-containing protein [Acidobacteriota bacterium]
MFVDVAYMYRNGGRGMRYDVLREFASRDHAELLRLNAYVSFDAERAETDHDYREGVNNFYSTLRDYGFKVIKKTVKWYEDDMGNRYGKANADLDLGVDALLQSENLDRVLIATGDGDFTQVVTALQNKGCRVETVALDNVSNELRYGVDMFMSGYLIPNLIPTRPEQGKPNASWGTLGSRVRGTCYWYNQEQGYGFMRFLDKTAPGLWLTDTRHPDSPYKTVYFHDSNLAENISVNNLPSRDFIFEFELGKSLRQEGGWQALNIDLSCKL